VNKKNKLYSWKPQTHGQLSFFVIASSKKESIKFIDDYIKDQKLEEYYSRGWSDGNYELDVLVKGEVEINDNS